MSKVTAAVINASIPQVRAEVDGDRVEVLGIKDARLAIYPLEKGWNLSITDDDDPYMVYEEHTKTIDELKNRVKEIYELSLEEKINND